MLTSLIHWHTCYKRFTLILDRITSKSLHRTQKMLAQTTNINLPKSKQTLLPVHWCLQVLLESNTLSTYIRLWDLDELKAITFISSKFSDTQCNYSAIVEKTFGIHMSVKRLSSLFSICWIDNFMWLLNIWKIPNGRKWIKIKSTIGT